MLEFLNQVFSHINKDSHKSYKKMKVISDNGINDRELTLIEEIKLIKQLDKRFSKQFGKFPSISDLKQFENNEICFIFNKLGIYPSNQYPSLNQHIELVQNIHKNAYSETSLKDFFIFLKNHHISLIDEFKEEIDKNEKNIPFIKLYILATLFSHLDVIINKQWKSVHPICLNELFRYRLNPLTSEIKDNKVIFHNQKSKFLLPSRQFLKLLVLWQNYDNGKNLFPINSRGLKLKELHNDSPYKSYVSELLKDINDTNELVPIYFDDIDRLITGFDSKNEKYNKVASAFSNNFQFHLLGVWLIYIFQNVLGQAYKLNNQIPVTPFWLELWESFLPTYDLDTKADHLIQWPADFFNLTKSIN